MDQCPHAAPERSGEYIVCQHPSMAGLKTPGLCHHCTINPLRLVWPTVPPPKKPQDFINAYKASRGTATVEKSPCVGCGDKTNVAEVKSSPEAMEKFLAE